MAVRSAEINVMAASAVKVARALARDFIELEQLQASKAGSANFTDRSFNNGAGIMQETLIKARPERKVHMSGASTLELDKNDDIEHPVIDNDTMLKLLTSQLIRLILKKVSNTIIV